MKDDFGYFGSGLEGYVQYNEAFKRNLDNASASVSTPEHDGSYLQPEVDSAVEDDVDTDADDEDLYDNEDI